ncbi:hypothetical protein SAMD00023353_2300290 [Rosellinia necatrix]|uniref:Uncharacterized protein n=1 Tax=Rosellinia necatrix TaxID=77044 RepID=A0A1W2TGI8_ROSNE|nr:hypothetical protein SAMD00023353_2300290 [Rosellinia necatrix]
MPHSSTGKARPSIADLEQAALSVVHLIQGVAGLANIRIALIGDLAVKKYLGHPGPCESIEFIVAKSASPSLVKKTLAAHGKRVIVETTQAIFYRHPAGWAVEVKITPEWLCPYLPDSAQPAAEVETLPCIGLADLFVFKADACGLHESDAGRQRQARDARALLELASEHFPLQLDDDKMQRVVEALDTLVEYSPPESDRRWWERRLGRQGDKRRSAQDILSELGEGLRLDEEESRRTMRRPSIFSLSARGSDTSVGSSPSMASQQPTPLPSPPTKMRPRKMSVSGSYPRPRRHTQTNMGSPLEDQLSPPLHPDYRDVHRLQAELMDTRGRSSPGISFMAFPGRG